MNKNLDDFSTCIAPSDRKEIHEILKTLPENETMYKCYHCNYLFDISQGGQANILTILKTRSFVYCPRCGERDPILICKVDAYSAVLKITGMKCRKEEVMPGTDLCPVCDRPICPECFNHSVVSLSRVTGYVQDISGWNNSKLQELKDRTRYSILV